MNLQIGSDQQNFHKTCLVTCGCDCGWLRHLHGHWHLDSEGSQWGSGASVAVGLGWHVFVPPIHGVQNISVKLWKRQTTYLRHLEYFVYVIRFIYNGGIFVSMVNRFVSVLIRYLNINIVFYSSWVSPSAISLDIPSIWIWSNRIWCDALVIWSTT